MRWAGIAGSNRRHVALRVVLQRLQRLIQVLQRNQRCNRELIGNIYHFRLHSNSLAFHVYFSFKLLTYNFLSLLRLGVLPTTTTSRRTTALNEFLTPEERADKIQRWGEIRAMTKEEAEANLSGEDLETYNNYYAEVREGVLKMQELAQLMMKDVDKAKGQEPKTKGQRKRDMWAKVQARAAANAAAAAN